MTLAPSLRFWVAKVLHLLKLLLPLQNPRPLRLPRQNLHLQSTQRQRLRLLSNQRPHRLPNQRLLLRQRQRPPQPKRQPQRRLLWRQQQVICCHRWCADWWKKTALTRQQFPAPVLVVGLLGPMC